MSRVKATESLPWQRLVRCVSGPAAGGAEQRCQLRGAREAPIAAACCLRDADGNKLLSVSAGHASGFYRPRVRKKGEKKERRPVLKGLCRRSSGTFLLTTSLWMERGDTGPLVSWSCIFSLLSCPGRISSRSCPRRSRRSPAELGPLHLSSSHRSSKKNRYIFCYGKLGLKHLLLHYCLTWPCTDQVNFLMK